MNMWLKNHRHCLGTLLLLNSAAAHKIQADSIIKYARGRIRVLDRPMLEKRTRECYQVVKVEYDWLLPHTLPI